MKKLSLIIAIAAILAAALATAAFAKDAGKKGLKKQPPPAKKEAVEKKTDAPEKKETLPKITRLQGFPKVVVIAHDPTPEELESLSKVKNVRLSIELVDKVSDKTVHKAINQYENFEAELLVPANATEKEFKNLAGEKFLMTFDFRKNPEINANVVALQSEYLPFSKKFVRLTDAQITEDNLKLLREFKSYSLELFLAKPLAPKAIDALNKITKNVTKHFVLPFDFPEAGEKALSKLNNVIITYDASKCQDLRKFLDKMSKNDVKVPKGIMIKGPFDEQTAMLLSAFENLAEIRIVMEGDVKPDFAAMLNRKK